MPGTRPKVTALIPTFNRADFVAECLDSILSQTLAPFQVIVINDGSTDRTPDVLRSYRSAIEYVETAQVGKPAAINAGLEKVAGDYLWIFDDDDVALPEALDRLVEPLERHPEHGFSYSTFFYTATRPQDHRIGPILGESAIPDLDERGFLVPLLEANFLGGAALFARTSCYERVGAFDVQLVRSQDYEMAIRIARRFTGIRVPGSPTFHYRQHEGLRGSTRDRFEMGARLRKWLQYDQMIFRKLHQQLPLAEYLPPGGSLDRQLRQAHLQRLSVMASKLLMPEVMADLQVLANLPGRTPLSEQERRIIHSTINRVPFYMEGSLNDHLEFFDEVRRLARSARVVQLIRAEMLRSLRARRIMTRPWRNPRQVAGTLRRGIRLYVAT